MRTAFIALSLLALGATSARAQEPPLWQSSEPTGIVRNADGAIIEYCYATIRLADGVQMYNPVECNTPAIRNYVSLSYPLAGPVVNMDGIPEAATVRINPDTGMIELR